MQNLQLESRLEQARSFVEEGRLLHAMQIYEQLISQDRTCLDAYLGLASIYEELKRYPAAEKLLTRALEDCGRVAKIICRLGDLCMQQEEYARAIEYYRLLETSKLPNVHYNLAISYFYLGDLVKAEKYLRVTLKYDPHFPKINETLGDLLIRKKAYSEAVRYLRRGIELNPYSAISHYLLGVAYCGLFDWKSAYEEFLTAIDMDPKEARAWESCGRVLLYLQRFDEAESYLRKALELDPDDAETLVDYGFLCLKRSQLDDAMDYFARALKLHPNHSRATEGKIQVQMMKKKRNRA